MNKQNEIRDILIEEILKIELEMFQNVRSRGYASCQEQPKAFRMMRWMGHSVLSDETLASYLDDLKQAQENGRNLMTEKYARMEGLIPALKEDPRIAGIIDEIAEVETSWMLEFSEKYPGISRGGEGFYMYLKSELETYSDRTLELYNRDLFDAKEQGINLAEKSYTNLFLRLGYESLDDVVRKTKQ